MHGWAMDLVKNISKDFGVVFLQGLVSFLVLGCLLGDVYQISMNTGLVSRSLSSALVLRTLGKAFSVGNGWETKAEYWVLETDMDVLTADLAKA